MSDLKTLAEIWESADRKPVKVCFKDSVKVYTLVGIHDGRGVIDLSKHDLTMTHFSDLPQWQVYNEPKKLVEHYPSVTDVVSMTKTGGMETAKAFGPFYTKGNCPDDVQLLTEYPPVMLEVEG